MTRVALITGAAGNIGKAIGHALARDGFDVALSDLTQHEQQLEVLANDLRQFAGRAVVVPADVTSKTDLQHAIATATRELGGFDVMVNNAGVAQVRASWNSRKPILT